MALRALLAIGSSLAFIGYGLHCLLSPSMRVEFERYRLPHLRALTGVLELVGGAGLLVGLAWPLALQLSSGGLALLMLCGLFVRARAGDPLVQWLQAACLLVLNAYLCVSSLRV